MSGPTCAHLQFQGECASCRRIREARGTPRVIQDAERDLKRDVPKVLDIVSGLFFGETLEKYGFVDKTPERAPIAAHTRNVTIDVEPVCPTCDGSKTLGAKGHEVPCPACKPKCETCGGRGRLGAAGHEVPCPRCTP